MTASAKIRKTLELPVDLAERLDAEARRRGVPMMKVIIEAIERMLREASGK